MPKTSAGILLFRRAPAGVEVLLVHPGGPFWAKKDEGAWSIPKGLADEGEDLLAAARREFLRRDRRYGRGGLSRPRRAQAAQRQDDRGLRARRRFRPGRAQEQHLLAGMAAALGPDGGIPRGRPGGVAFDRRSVSEDKQRPDVDPGRPGQKARGRGARPEGRAGLTRQALGPRPWRPLHRTPTYHPPLLIDSRPILWLGWFGGAWSRWARSQAAIELTRQ